MTKLSRINLDSKIMDEILKNFWKVVTLLENIDQVKEFLYDILSPTEMKMLAKRLQIAKMLLDGYDYQSIRNLVKVTDQTIAKINNKLNTDGQGYKTAVSALQKIEEQLDDKRMGRSPLADALEKYKSKRPPEFLDFLEKGIKKYRKVHSIPK